MHHVPVEFGAPCGKSPVKTCARIMPSANAARLPDLQMIKECKIHLGHLKTHRDTARRLRSMIRRDTDQQSVLQQQQASATEEMQTCALCA